MFITNLKDGIAKSVIEKKGVFSVVETDSNTKHLLVELTGQMDVSLEADKILYIAGKVSESQYNNTFYTGKGDIMSKPVHETLSLVTALHEIVVDKSTVYAHDDGINSVLLNKDSTYVCIDEARKGIAVRMFNNPMLLQGNGVIAVISSVVNQDKIIKIDLDSDESVTVRNNHVLMWEKALTCNIVQDSCTFKGKGKVWVTLDPIR